MKKILVTGIGGDVAQGIATIIRESYSDYYLVGTDLSEYNAARVFVDKFYIVPAASSKIDYISHLKKIFNAENIDIVIPTTEPELEVVKSGIPISGISWITCGESTIEVGIDKLKTIECLSGLGIQVPWTQPVALGTPNVFPCILKSRFGSGSRNFFVVRDVDDATFLSRRYPDAIFQELLLPDDQEVTCAVYRTRDQQIGVLQLLRRLTGGLTSWAKVIDIAEIEETCKVLAEALSLQGSMNVQLRITDKGIRIFEINPRFSSTALMRHRMGFSDVLWAIAEAEGKPVQLARVDPGIIGLRIQDAIVYQN